MDHEAVRQVLQTMRANIARYGFSPETGERGGPRCFIGHAPYDSDDALGHLRGFVPDTYGFGVGHFGDENLRAAGITTDSALSIIDAALVALPGHQTVAQPEAVTA